jgi:NitT/TauT family transport system ATP-binding protein
MKRRVAIARAVCYASELLILDEPFKGLDVKLRQSVMDYIKRHADGRTIICVTHDPAEAEYMGGNLIDMGVEA